MDKIKLELPSNPQYIQMLRLTVASLSNKIGFDIEKIEDAKVLISEVFTYLLSNKEKINVEFFIDESSLQMNFEKNKELESGLNDINLELKKQILQSLSDEIYFEDEKISVKLNK